MVIFILLDEFFFFCRGTSCMRHRPGRSPEIYEQKGNVWTDAEAMAVNTPGVDTCVTIGACDWQYFRPDRWAGHVLQVRLDTLSYVGPTCELRP